MQQLAGALGVASVGTLFFSTLAHHGYVAALSHALVAQLLSLPVLFGLLSALPRHARDPEGAGAGGSAAEGSTPEREAEGAVSWAR